LKSDVNDLLSGKALELKRLSSRALPLNRSLTSLFKTSKCYTIIRDCQY